MVIWEKRSRTAVSGHGYWSERKSSSSLQEVIHSGATEHMNTSGATEHRAERWQAALASANLGMAGKAFTGSKWENKHKPQLIRQFVELLSAPNVQSLHFTEIGNIDDPITDLGEKNLKKCFGKHSVLYSEKELRKEHHKSYGPRRNTAPPALHGEEMFAWSD